MATSQDHFQQMAALAQLVEHAYLEGYRQGARNTAELPLPPLEVLNREAEDSWLFSDSRDDLCTEQSPALP